MKQWKENPPGDEQIALDAMFDNGDIEDHETAATIQARVPMFKPFSSRVFTVHFNKTRAKFGYCGNLNEKSFKKIEFVKNEFL